MTTTRGDGSPRARANFGAILARARIERKALAQAAGVSAQTINTLAAPQTYGRRGTTRLITAWAIAQGYAALTGMGEEQAYALLFEETEQAPGA